MAEIVTQTPAPRAAIADTRPQAVLIKTIVPYDQRFSFFGFMKNSVTTFRVNGQPIISYVQQVADRGDGLAYYGITYPPSLFNALVALVTEHEQWYMAGLAPR